MREEHVQGPEVRTLLEMLRKHKMAREAGAQRAGGKRGKVGARWGR